MQSTPLLFKFTFTVFCVIPAAGGTNTHAGVHQSVRGARAGVWLVATHSELDTSIWCEYIRTHSFSSDTYGIGSPIMQRVPKPGEFTKVSTTRDTSTLSGPSLLEISGISLNKHTFFLAAVSG